MHTISNKREWNNCFIKNNQELLQDLADFALQEQPEDNLMVSIEQGLYFFFAFFRRAEGRNVKNNACSVG